MTPDSAHHLLMYFLIPLWITAGFADWLCHRSSDIEHTAGPKESIIHLLMLAELGLPMLAVLLLEINALVIAIMLAAFIVHEATALLDVRYAVSKRVVTPWEQHMHSFLEVIPLMAMLLVLLLHQGQFMALFGLGIEVPNFNVTWKLEPVPQPYLLALFSAVVIFLVLPYLNELWRGIQAHRQRVWSEHWCCAKHGLI